MIKVRKIFNKIFTNEVILPILGLIGGTCLLIFMVSVFVAMLKASWLYIFTGTF